MCSHLEQKCVKHIFSPLFLITLSPRQAVPSSGTVINSKKNLHKFDSGTAIKSKKNLYKFGRLHSICAPFQIPTIAYLPNLGFF